MQNKHIDLFIVIWTCFLIFWKPKLDTKPSLFKIWESMNMQIYTWNDNW
jgi:hypothetical protein